MGSHRIILYLCRNAMREQRLVVYFDGGKGWLVPCPHSRWGSEHQGGEGLWAAGGLICFSWGGGIIPDTSFTYHLHARQLKDYG